jgi:hypothetical protein
MICRHNIRGIVVARGGGGGEQAFTKAKAALRLAAERTREGLWQPHLGSLPAAAMPQLL